jgi:C_GCAxxG_C_C family probable redox protein
MMKSHGCAQSILAAFMGEFGIDDPLVFTSAGALHAGLFSSFTCGVHIGGLMVLGLIMGREKIEHGIDGLFPIVGPAQKMVARLNRRLGSSSCRELSGVDFTDLRQAMQFYSSGENERCYGFVEQGAEEIALCLKEFKESGELFRPEL